MKYEYKVQGVDYDVEIEEVEGNLAKVKVNGVAFDVELKKPINPTRVKTPKVQAPVVKPAAAPVAQPAAQTAAPAAPVAAGSGTPVKAPLPGTITSISVNVGDKVANGQTVVVLEAMKMQNNIESECDGTVTAILVKPGDAVAEGQALITVG